jgi:uncharacterized protein (TIGR02678 family)
LLCLICAELVRHPVTTVGLLAAAITADSALDTGKHGERSAFVDALRALVSWGAVRVTSGEVDAFVDSEQANAILTADTARLHRLIVSSTPPSALPGDVPIDAAIESLAAEPRYGVAADESESASDDLRNRWARHRVARRLLDDPVTYLDDLIPAERDYLSSPSGRRWLRDRCSAAGLELEERSEGLLAVDPDSVATDSRFPAPQGNAYQLALLLADRLVPAAPDGRRTLGRLTPEALRAAVHDVLDRYPAWARGEREGDGPMRLAQKAIGLLVAHGLAHRDPDGTTQALPALARYRIGEAIVHGAPTLFEGNGDD